MSSHFEWRYYQNLSERGTTRSDIHMSRIFSCLTCYQPQILIWEDECMFIVAENIIPETVQVQASQISQAKHNLVWTVLAWQSSSKNTWCCRKHYWGMIRWQFPLSQYWSILQHGNVLLEMLYIRWNTKSKVLMDKVSVLFLLICCLRPGKRDLGKVLGQSSTSVQEQSQ